MADGAAQLEEWRAAARAAAAAGDPATAGDYYGRLIPRLPEPDQVEALLDWGAVAQRAGQWREAEAHYRQALALAERSPDRVVQARSGATLARLLEGQGAFDQALTILAAARDDFAALGDEDNLQQVLGRMARAYISLGDYTEALACCGEKLEIATRLHLARETAQARYLMGTIYTQQGAYDQALACFAESLRQAIGAGNRADVALAKDHMGLIYATQGQYAEALACYAEALEITEALGNRRNVSHIAAHIGQIYLAYGDYARAHTCCVYLLQTALGLGDRPRHERGPGPAGRRGAAPGTLCRGRATERGGHRPGPRHAPELPARLSLRRRQGRDAPGALCRGATAGRRGVAPCHRKRPQSLRV